MKFFHGKYYVGLKDKRYRIHPTEKIILGLHDEPKLIRTENQVQIDTQIRKNQKDVEDTGRLENKSYLKTKKQPIQQQPSFKPPDGPSFKKLLRIWYRLLLLNSRIWTYH